MKGHWEYLDRKGMWRPCSVDTKDIEEHLSSDYNYQSLHRFTLDHEHVFNKCECGEVKE